MAAGTEVGYYTLPVILSFDGIEKSVNSKLGKAFKDVGKKSSKALADGTEADLKRAADAYGKLRDKAADALGKVRVEEEKLKKARDSGKADQITAAEERLNKARRDSRRLTSEAAASYAELEDAQNKLRRGTGSLGDGFGKLSDLAGTAGKALVAAGVVAASAAAAGIAALTAGLVVAGRELYDLGQTWDDVTDSIAVKTGKLGPDLQTLKNNIKDIAPTTASSIGAIGDVVGSVSQALRLSGQDLEQVSKNIVDLNRLTGENLDVRELGKAFRGFGVDAADAVPTLDALYRVSAATGISVNQLLTSIVKAGPAARTMGLSLDQTAALLSTFNDAGIDADLALKSLALAAKTLAKDGKAPAQGLRETVTEIDNLLRAGREADAINLAAKIFGRGYAPLLDAIRNGALDAQSLNNALADGGVTIQDVATATADWSERWQQLKNTLSVALEPLASGVFSVINAKLDQLADWITANQSKVVAFFQTIATVAFDAAQAVVQFAAKALRGLGDLITNLTGALKPVFDAFADIGGVLKFVPGFGQLGDGLQKIGQAGQAITGAFEKAPGYLKGAADALERDVLPAIQTGQDYTQAFLERTKQATRFVEKLGDVVATLNKDGEIVLSDNTPELRDRLAEVGVSVQELPDGTIKVTADTEEGQQILQAWRDQQEGKPVEIAVKPDKTKSDSFFDEYRKFLEGKPIEIPVSPNPLNPGGVYGPDVPIPGKGPRRFASLSNLNPLENMLVQQLQNAGLSADQIRGIVAMNKVESGGKREGFLGFTNGQAPTPQIAIDRFLNEQWKPRTANGIPGVDQSGQVVDWDAFMTFIRVKIVGQTGVIDWQGNQQPNPQDYQNRLMQALGGGGGMRGFTSNAVQMTPRGVAVGVEQAAQVARSMFGLEFTSGRRSEPGSFHNSGLAGDFSNGTNLTPQMRAFAEYMSSNFGDQIAELIYGDPTFAGNIGGPYSQSTLDQHRNHVHVAFKPGSPGMRNFGPNGPAPMDMSGAIDTSGLYMDPAASPMSYGTPGVNDQGQPGMFVPDPKRVREAEQRKLDAQEAVRAADADVAQARARLNELPYDAEQSQRLAADEGVRQAEYRAQKARREAADAAADFAEAQKGEFTKAKDGGGGQGGGGMGGNLGGVGSILSSFLGDTFGIGSWLPALDNLMPLQMADTLIGSFMGPITGAMQGKLGIQQPGWQPGMPVDALGDMSTSSAPFGIPTFGAPPMPENGQHGGSGAPPGPGTVVNVDQSQNFNNSPLGWDPVKVDKVRTNNINRAPRLPVGMGS